MLNLCIDPATAVLQQSAFVALLMLGVSIVSHIEGQIVLYTTVSIDQLTLCTDACRHMWQRSSCCNKKMEQEAGMTH